LQCIGFQVRDCCGQNLKAGQQCGCTPGIGGFQKLCLYSVVSTNPTVVQTGVNVLPCAAYPACVLVQREQSITIEPSMQTLQ
jgi:hypothetical protein